MRIICSESKSKKPFFVFQLSEIYKQYQWIAEKVSFNLMYGMLRYVDNKQ